MIMLQQDLTQTAIDVAVADNIGVGPEASLGSAFIFTRDAANAIVARSKLMKLVVVEDVGHVCMPFVSLSEIPVSLAKSIFSILDPWPSSDRRWLLERCGSSFGSPETTIYGLYICSGWGNLRVRRTRMRVRC